MHLFLFGSRSALNSLTNNISCVLRSTLLS
nr:MAG TPA: hypothetical protein [Bacteriophage sp.]